MINGIFDLNNITDANLHDMFDDINFDIRSLDDINVEPYDENYQENINNPNMPNHDKTNEGNTFDDACPNCSVNDSVFEDVELGIIICKNCGQVIDNLMDSGPEWRNYEDGGKKDASRCSIPVNKLLPQSSLGTSMAGNCKSRMRTIQMWSRIPYRERSLNNVFKIIQEKCLQGNILKCIEDDAKILYKKISECKHVKGRNKGKFIIIRGKNRKSLIAACLFFACRKNNKTRSPKEIADLFDLKYTEINKGCKNFLKFMKLRKMDLGIGISQPEHFVIRFCNELRIKTQYIDQAVKIAQNITKLNVASVHTPFSTAISSILLMAEINNLKIITKKKLALKFKVSEVTITKTYKKLEQYKKILLDDKLIDTLIVQIKKSKENEAIPSNVLERFKKFNITPKTNSNNNSD